MSDRSDLIVTRSIMVAASLVLAATCTDEQVGVQAGPHLLAATFSEEFHIGDNPDERPFAHVVSMAFTANGHLVVVDRDNFNVVVFDDEGREVLEWGGQGEGPGEFETEPAEVAVSEDGSVAVSSFRRVTVFTAEGTIVGSHLSGDLFGGKVAFDGNGHVVAESAAGGELFAGRETESQSHLVRLRDNETIWSGRTVDAGSGIAFFIPRPIVAQLRDGRIAATMSDRYEIDILDGSSGTVLGRLVRPSAMPRPTPEALKAGLRESLTGGTDDPVLAEIYGDVTFGETLPVVSNVFPGPPGRTVWVRRGIGVGDELAPAVGDDMEAWAFHLYDLFDSRSYEFIGTVEVPDGFEPLAGDGERIAGVQRGALDVQSVRVLHVVIDPPGSG